jgi:hypothetical protein
MPEIVTLELPDHVVHSAREVAAQTHRRVEDVLVDWMEKAAADVPVDALSDADILRLCDLQLSAPKQDALHDLLARNREGQLDATERPQLDALMQQYRRGLVRKAQAWQVAVTRGLRAPLA